MGEAKLPTVELFDSPNEGLIFRVASTAPSVQQGQQPQTQQRRQQEQPATQTKPSLPLDQGNEPIELVLTGQQDGYRVPDASTATKTDTPLRDIPQAIEVVPQQVIQDQQANRLIDVLKNVPGVAQTQSFRTDAALFYKRGRFRAGLNFKNLFNINYFQSASSRNSVFYGDPFTVQGTISWQF